MIGHKRTYCLEMRAPDPRREVTADSFGQTDSGWLIFYRDNPQGGKPLEYWRVRLEAVISMETKRV